MIFNSSQFLVFFLAFFFIYWTINRKSSISVRNSFLILSSYLFYGWWDWRFLGLLFASSTVDFTVGYLLNNSENQRFRKGIFISSLIFNLGILCFFKYFNFFIDSVSDFLTLFSLKVNITTLKIVLPVGISFYTFQSLSYTIDVYKRKIEPTLDYFSFYAYVSFFPQLVAGPIERPAHFLKQFQVKKVFSYGNSVEGLRLVLWGFFKKIVIADNFGVLADAVFESKTSIPGLSVIAGTTFFALQIYADFSGYSDIAIGISRMLGFDLMTNFKTPYFAKSFNDFWSRWHISLSTWFRDYVYIPLGGNRKGNFRVSLNILLTFLLSGLWHGANFTFLIWGGLHGLVLVLEKQIKIKISKFIYVPIVIITVILFWLPFRAENITHLKVLTSAMINIKTYSTIHLQDILTDFSIQRFATLIAVTALFFLIEFNMQLRDFNQWIAQKNKLTRIAFYYLLLVLILLVGNFSVKPSFIYFQF